MYTQLYIGLYPDMGSSAGMCRVCAYIYRFLNRRVLSYKGHIGLVQGYREYVWSTLRLWDPHNGILNLSSQSINLPPKGHK